MFDLITGWIQTGGLAMVGLLMVLENVFPPIPSELIVPLAGYEAAQGSFSLIALLIVATLGSLLGTLIWYGLARAWGHDRFLRFVDRWGPWLTLSPEEADRAMDWFARHGRAAVFFGRLVPTVRTLISVPAGLSGMNPLTFLLFTAAGSFLWIVILAGAGYLLRENYDRVEQWLNPLSTLVVILILGTYLYRLVTSLWRRGRR